MIIKKVFNLDESIYYFFWNRTEKIDSIVFSFMRSYLFERQAAKVFNITRATAAKWLGGDDTQDRSHRALTQKATLTPP